MVEKCFTKRHGTYNLLREKRRRKKCMIGHFLCHDGALETFLPVSNVSASDFEIECYNIENKKKVNGRKDFYFILTDEVL